MKIKKGLALWLILLAAVFVASMLALGSSNEKENSEREIAIGEFVSQVEHGEVKDVVITGNTVHGTTVDGQKIRAFSSNNQELYRVMREKNVPYSEKAPTDWSIITMILLKLVVPIFVLFAFFRVIKKAGPGEAARAHALNKSTMHKDVKTTFADVAGIDEAVEEVKELVGFLKEPEHFTRLGGRMPKGVLLMGPSGTGKTLLARAVAGEAGVPFFAASAAGFVEMFVGVGAARVRDLFENAKKHSPCIVFIDELDAVGKKRSGMSGFAGHSEMEQTLNELLVQMDGFAPSQGIIVIGATNRPDVLDSALLRAGRFDRKVAVPMPDVKGREAILQVHAKGKPFAPGVDLSIIARGTPGMSGADLEELLNEAAIIAGKNGRQAIEHVDIEAAKEKIYMGPERKSTVLSDKERKIIAWHESGHTVAGWYTAEADPPHRVTIIPRNMALGLTWSLPTEDRKLLTRNEFLAQIKCLLGGRVAEEMLLGPDNITSGASNDLQRVTSSVVRMVKEFGMTQEVGLRTFGESPGPHQGFGLDTGRNDYSNETAKRLDDAVDAIIKKEHEFVRELLLLRKDVLAVLAAELLHKETLDANDLLRILGPRPKPTGVM